MIELIFTGFIIALAATILYKKTISKNSGSNGCGCSSCSSSCPKFKGAIGNKK